MPEKKFTVVACLDADGCFFTPGYTRLAMEKAKANALRRTHGQSDEYHSGDVEFLEGPFLKSNQLLTEHILTFSKNAGAQEVITACFSARQYTAIDLRNGYRISIEGESRRERRAPCCTGSVVPPLFAITRKLYKDRKAEAAVYLDPDLAGDRDNGRPSGTTFRKLLRLTVEQQFDSADQKHELLSSEVSREKKRHRGDHNKIILMSHMAARASALHRNGHVILCAYDNSPLVTDPMSAHYQEHPEELPSNTTLNIYHYDGSDEPSLCGSIQGRGEIPTDDPEASYVEVKAEVKSSAKMKSPEDKKLERIISGLKEVVNLEGWGRQGKGLFWHKRPKGLEAMGDAFCAFPDAKDCALLFTELRSIAQKQTSSLRGSFFGPTGVRARPTRDWYDLVGSLPLNPSYVDMERFVRRLAEFKANHAQELGIGNGSSAQSHGAAVRTPLRRACV